MIFVFSDETKREVDDKRKEIRREGGLKGFLNT